MPGSLNTKKRQAVEEANGDTPKRARGFTAVNINTNVPTGPRSGSLPSSRQSPASAVSELGDVDGRRNSPHNFNTALHGRPQVQHVATAQMASSADPQAFEGAIKKLLLDHATNITEMAKLKVRQDDAEKTLKYRQSEYVQAKSFGSDYQFLVTWTKDSVSGAQKILNDMDEQSEKQRNLGDRIIWDISSKLAPAIAQAAISNVGAPSSQLDEMQRNMDNLQKRVEKQEAEISQERAAKRDLEQRLRDVESKQQSFSDVDKKVETLTKQLRDTSVDIGGKCDALGRSVRQTETEIRILKEKTSESAKNNLATEKALESIGDLQKDLASLKVDVGEAVSMWKSEAASFKATADSLRDGLASYHDEQKETCGSLETKVGGLAAEVERVKQECLAKADDSRYVELRGHVDTLQRTVTQVQQERNGSALASSDYQNQINEMLKVAVQSLEDRFNNLTSDDMVRRMMHELHKRTPSGDVDTRLNKFGERLDDFKDQIIRLRGTVGMAEDNVQAFREQNKLDRERDQERFERIEHSVQETRKTLDKGDEEAKKNVGDMQAKMTWQNVSMQTSIERLCDEVKIQRPNWAAATRTGHG